MKNNEEILQKVGKTEKLEKLIYLYFLTPERNVNIQKRYEEEGNFNN
jgi:hypothetical protein